MNDFCFARILIAVLVGAVAAQAHAGVTTSVKTLRDTTHIEISGLNEWRYDVRRAGGEYPKVSVQVSAVSPGDIKSLMAVRDPRIRAIDIRDGTTGGAEIVFTLADKNINLFDYQTDSPVNLVFDVYKDTPQASKTGKLQTAKEKQNRRSKFDGLVAMKPKVNSKANSKVAQKKILASRGIASVDGADKNEALALRYGIFDGGDQEMTRFKIDDAQVSEVAKVKSEENIYLHFPALNYEHNYLAGVLKAAPEVSVEKIDSEENETVRLMIKLYGEGKYAVLLRTLKFFKEKFHETVYQKTIDRLVADTYYKLWQRDHDRSDFETAIAKYKDLLNKYSNDVDRYRILMLIGLSYLDAGNELGALSTFQVGIQKYADSPYFWQMRMAVAESFNRLDKPKDALSELEKIESDPKAGEYAVEARFRRGDVAFRNGDYALAVKEYDQALKKYPQNWSQAPNIYFNSAEADFWLKNYKSSVDSFRAFLQRFPSHPHGGYAMTRIGEVLEITGAPLKKATGAYLESYFRYRGTPGAFIARVHMQGGRYPAMKDKEAKAFEDEAREQVANLKLQDLDTFVTLTIADGRRARGEFVKSGDAYVDYYQRNLLSPYLPIFKNRIIQNITSEMESLDEKKDYVKGLELYIKNQNTWLAKSTRIDTRYFVGRAYEALNVPDDATKEYAYCLGAISSATPTQTKRIQAFEHAPTLDTVNLRLAKTSMKADDIRKAASYVSAIKNPAALSEGEQVERSLVLAAVAEKEEKPEIALLALTDLTDHWKGNPVMLAEPWLKMARIQRDLKKPNEALPWVEKVTTAALTKEGASISSDVLRDAFEMSGDLNAQLGKYKEAAGAYKTWVDKYSNGVPGAPVKYKLGKAYFEQKNYAAATEVWSTLKDENEGEVWQKMADEQLAQAKWNDKYNRYIKAERKPAGGNK